eukprot:GFKZ01012321.1.p1 GENE.GFKZ01012321.1~~GFKZ01012321.1.p1  ORF type:complete len:260 (-),score=33.34 GFKZ01012321.1:388-1167(-)
MSSSFYQPLSLSRAFPKIAVVCGAHTELGQQVLLELLNSPEIEKVHAIASKDIPILDRLSRSTLRKATVHILSFDHLRHVLNKIPEADIAFCALGTERGAQNSIGMSKFRLLNVDAPSRFVRGMFELGVLYVAVLSHANADKGSKSELYHARGELEGYVRRLRKEAAEFSPFISMFKVSNMGAHRASSSKRSSRREDSLRYHEVATAMRIDALQKSARRRLSDKTKRSKYEELDSTDVLRLNREARYPGGEEGTPFWYD